MFLICVVVIKNIWKILRESDENLKWRLRWEKRLEKNYKKEKIYFGRLMHSTAYQSVHMRRLSEKRRRKSSKEKADRAVALLGYCIGGFIGFPIPSSDETICRSDRWNFWIKRVLPLSSGICSWELIRSIRQSEKNWTSVERKQNKKI